MKLIIAYIQPYRLSEVKEELVKERVLKMSITNCLGCGQQGGFHGTWKGLDYETNLLKKVRIEIAVNDEFLDRTIDAIIRGAQTNSIGDGKIFVLPIESSIRIRNRETGPRSIG